MSEQEKSEMLAKLAGWDYEHDGVTGDWLAGPGGEVLHSEWATQLEYGDVVLLNLYDPANMALAWRVLNWAGHNLPEPQGTSFIGWWDAADLWEDSPIEAARLWLDKILELCQEAGMIEAS